MATPYLSKTAASGTAEKSSAGLPVSTFFPSPSRSKSAPEAPTAGTSHAPSRAIDHARNESKIRRRNRLITSCLECRRRKLKCDKKQPECSNCAKFARECLFLGPALDSESQQKLAEFKEKLGSLERVLEEDVMKKTKAKSKGDDGANMPLGLTDVESSDEGPMPEDERMLRPTPLAVVDAAYDDDADDEMMDLGISLGKLRITERIGGFVRPRFSEELNSIVQDPRIDGGAPEGSTSQSGSPYAPNTQSSPKAYLGPGPDYIAPSSSFFLPYGAERMSIVDFLPSKDAADKLIQRYWLAVHPLLRIVHRPSFQRQYETFWRYISVGQEPPYSMQGVIFAAMMSAAISMTEDDVAQRFGVARPGLVENFKLGTEMALSKAKVLQTTKLETLQAFVMYLLPLCRSEISRAHSALTGAAIRLAECMGLHRDGTQYGLGPVDTHVRRMIWYQLCWLDIRTCEATGPRPQIRREEFDTKMPLNVNDTDLESLTPPTEDAKAFTDMTISRMRFEGNEMNRYIWNERPKLEKRKTTITAVLGRIEKFRIAMDEKWLPLLTPSAVPLHKAAYHIQRIINVRMHIMVLHRYHQSVEQAMPDRLRQILIRSGTEMLETAVGYETDPLLKPWHWYAGALQQYHVALLLLTEVYMYPMRKEADRIWKCCDYIFEIPDPTMPRADKAREILKELVERIGAYHSMRRVRAPTKMLGKIGIPSGAIDAAGYRPPSITAIAETVNAAPQDFTLFHGVANGEALFAPPPISQSSPEASSEANSGGGGGSRAGSLDNLAPSGLGSQDVDMDIDWNEWDRLFPPETNTGELNLPDFTMPYQNFYIPKDQPQTLYHIPGMQTTQAPTTQAGKTGEPWG